MIPYQTFLLDTALGRDKLLLASPLDYMNDVDRIISQMSERDQEIIDLRYKQNMTLSGIVKELGITLYSAKSRLATAERRLKFRLQPVVRKLQA